MGHVLFQVPCFRTAAAVVSYVPVSPEPSALSMHLPKNGMEQFEELILVPICAPFKCRTVPCAGARCHGVGAAPMMTVVLFGQPWT